MQELAFAWPQTGAALGQLAAAAQVVLPAVGLAGVPLAAPLRQLSDGYQRRAALAAALVRRPAVLLLDEPLAGLDWRARADVAGVLGALLPSTLSSALISVLVSWWLSDTAVIPSCAWGAPASAIRA